jgi:hypothetical protein
MTMASSSSTLVQALPLQPISEKLTRSNFPIWKALVFSALMGAQLSEFLNEKIQARLRPC